MGREVAFLDDDDDLRELVTELLAAVFDTSCVPLASHDELVEKGDRVLACNLAILDVNLGADAASGIDSYKWLREHGFRGRVAFLTGHASSHPLVAEARRVGDARVLEKPIRTELLESLLDVNARP